MLSLEISKTCFKTMTSVTQAFLWDGIKFLCVFLHFYLVPVLAHDQQPIRTTTILG